MKKELPYFYIGSAYGGWQEWFPEYMMRVGGCAAVTACDCSIYFMLYKEIKGLYPYDLSNITKEDYIRFAGIMKPYLSPRWSGIDRLEIYVEGFGKFLCDNGQNELSLIPWSGENSINNTMLRIKRQIDLGWPIPCLTLNHRNPYLNDYVWHWFLLTGYEELENRFMVKTVTYGSWRWFNFTDLWDTGYSRKGGLILFGNG